MSVLLLRLLSRLEDLLRMVQWGHSCIIKWSCIGTLEVWLVLLEHEWLLWELLLLR